MSTVQQIWPVYALLADGSTVEIRPAEPRDFDAVKAMHEVMSPDNAPYGVTPTRQQRQRHHFRVPTWPANGRPSVWVFWSAPMSPVCRALRVGLG